MAAGLRTATALDSSLVPDGVMPSVMLNNTNDMLWVLTYSDGKVIAGFATSKDWQNSGEVNYPEPSDDGFYTAEINATTTTSLGGVPAFAGLYDDFVLSVFDNLDGTFGGFLFSTLNTSASGSALPVRR